MENNRKKNRYIVCTTDGKMINIVADSIDGVLFELGNEDIWQIIKIFD